MLSFASLSDCSRAVFAPDFNRFIYPIEAGRTDVAKFWSNINIVRASERTCASLLKARHVIRKAVPHGQEEVMSLLLRNGVVRSTRNHDISPKARATLTGTLLAKPPSTRVLPSISTGVGHREPTYWPESPAPDYLCAGRPPGRFRGRLRPRGSESACGRNLRLLRLQSHLVKQNLESLTLHDALRDAETLVVAQINIDRELTLILFPSNGQVWTRRCCR